MTARHHERYLQHCSTFAALADGPPLDLELLVTLHFQPGRLVAGQPLLAHLAADPAYRSQFETGTSNGGLTAHLEAIDGAGSKPCSAAPTTTAQPASGPSTVR